MQLKLDMSCHLLNVYTKFQTDISKQVEEKSGKRGRPDRRTDRHCHGIIRPFFKRAYKNCTTSQRQTNSGNTVEHQSSLMSSLMTSPTKFEVILISYSSTMHGNCSTNQTPPEWVHLPSFRSIQSVVYQKMCRNLESVADEVMHGQGQMIWYL